MSTETIDEIARRRGRSQLHPGRGMCATAKARLQVIQDGGAPQSVYGRRMCQRTAIDDYVVRWLVDEGWKAEEVASATTADPDEATFATSMAQSLFAGPLPRLAKTSNIAELITHITDVNTEIASWADKTQDDSLAQMCSTRSSLLASLAARSSYFQLQPEVINALKRTRQSTQIQNRYIIFPEYAVRNKKHDSLGDNETRCREDMEALRSAMQACTRPLLMQAAHSDGNTEGSSLGI